MSTPSGPACGFTAAPAYISLAGKTLCDEPKNLADARSDIADSCLPVNAYGRLSESRHAEDVHRQVVEKVDELIGPAVRDLTDLVNELFDRCQLYPRNDQDLFQQQENLRRH